MKSYSPERAPNLVTYRKYTNFDKEKFIDEIYFNLPKHILQELTLETFINMFKTVFEKHAPLKKKYLKALLDVKLLAKLFSKVTKNNLIYVIVYRVFYRKLNQRLLKEGKE